MIYLTHPLHGVKVATIEAEAVYDEAHGWMRFDPEAVEPEEVELEAVAPELVLAPRARPKAV